MRTVLIDSPGPSPEPHWSGAFVSAVGASLEPRGVAVRQLSGSAVPPAPVHRVTAGLTDIPHEIALTKALRSEPAHVVLHAGVGARGSPNLLWIADRMGSAAVAVVRAREVVCQRGDLIDRDRAHCERTDDPERCAWCCRRSFWRRSTADDFRTRIDLVVAGLQACSAIWVAEGDDSAMLERVGVPARLLETAPAENLVEAVATSVRSLLSNPTAS